MKIREHWSCALLAALTSAAAPSLHAADPQAVEKPYLEVGDCWSYRALNLDYHGSVGDYKECITFIDRKKNLVMALATLKDGGREVETSYTKSWTSRTAIDGTLNTSAPGQELLRFPLHSGDTYTFETEWRRALLGSNAGKLTWNLKVVGWEDLTVPAGTYRALKIEAQGMVRRSDVYTSYPVTLTVWYSPEVSNMVKVVFSVSGNERGRELTAYRLNQ